MNNETELPYAIVRYRLVSGIDELVFDSVMNYQFMPFHDAANVVSVLNGQRTQSEINKGIQYFISQVSL